MRIVEAGEELGLDRFKGMLEEKRALPANAFADTLLDDCLTVVRENLGTKLVR